MTLWHVMKTYKENDVYYQVLPYDTRVIYDLLQMRRGVQQLIKFMRNSRWIEKRDWRLGTRRLLVSLFFVWETKFLSDLT